MPPVSAFYSRLERRKSSGCQCAANVFPSCLRENSDVRQSPLPTHAGRTHLDLGLHHDERRELHRRRESTGAKGGEGRSPSWATSLFCPFAWRRRGRETPTTPHSTSTTTPIRRALKKTALRCSQRFAALLTYSLLLLLLLRPLQRTHQSVGGGFDRRHTWPPPKPSAGPIATTLFAAPPLPDVAINWFRRRRRPSGSTRRRFSSPNWTHLPLVDLRLALRYRSMTQARAQGACDF